MKCTLCGHEFDETQAPPACKACVFRHGCDLVRCPNCGFEHPIEPSWVQRLRKRFAGRKGKDERDGAG